MDDNKLVYAVLVYNFLIIAGAAFLVAVYDWSLWTFVFALIIMFDIDKVTDKDD